MKKSNFTVSFVANISMFELASGKLTIWFEKTYELPIKLHENCVNPWTTKTYSKLFDGLNKKLMSDFSSIEYSVKVEFPRIRIARA